jgi:DMSO/TMAO reductase YedYZ molybdopterin-dependent catalytic subunit
VEEATVEDDPMTDLRTRVEGYSQEELQLATRNRGMPLEALRHDLTPTGMHFLLVHFDIPDVDPQTWELAITGDVATPLELTLPELRARPARTLPVTLECAGNGRALLEPRAISQPWLHEAVGTAEWTGAPLADLLREADVGSDTVEFVFTGSDRGVQGGVEHDYQRSLTRQEVDRDEVLLAYEMNGRPLEPQHGAPVRLLVPGWYGMTSVKWLRSIEAVTEPFDGFQQADAYRLQDTDDDPGERVTRIRVRALMIPPGIPDFLTRHRLVDAGPVELRGRAWSGTTPVARVEIAVDGIWHDAELDEPIGRYAWRGWRTSWVATPGEHVLSCRATDADGATQPTDPPWNVQGMANNQVQVIPVTVR